MVATIHTPSGRSSPVKDHSEIRFPITSGIAGFVASTSQALNLPDAYEDPRFNKEIDLRTGYRTRSVICGPVCDSSGKIIGVLQAINKGGEGSVFTEDDEVLLQEITRMVGGAVEKCFVHDGVLHQCDLTLAKERNRTAEIQENRRILEGETRLLQVADHLSEDLELAKLFKNVVNHVPFALSAERATLFLYNKASNELSSRSTSNEGEEFRFSASSGLAGYAATTGTTVNVKDAYEDSRFNKKFDASSGFITKQVLAAPIFDPNDSR